jgi:polyphosphate kinase
VYLSSADWMPRNFERRVEVMFPIEAEDLRKRIVEEILPAYMSDNRRTRVLNPDGTYSRVIPPSDQPGHRSQVELLTLAAAREEAELAEDTKPLSFDAISDLMPAASENGAAKDRKRKKKRRPASRR